MVLGHKIGQIAARLLEGDFALLCRGLFLSSTPRIKSEQLNFLSSNTFGKRESAPSSRGRENGNKLRMSAPSEYAPQPLKQNTGTKPISRIAKPVLNPDLLKTCQNIKPE
jgi:hypothetical protein